MVEVTNGWTRVPLDRLGESRTHTLEIYAGSPMRPGIVDEDVARKGSCFGGQTRSQLVVKCRPFVDLLPAKQAYVRLLPSHCMVNKKLLPLFAHYRLYMGEVLLRERMQQFRRVEHDPILAQFGEVIDCADVIPELITHWDAVL